MMKFNAIHVHSAPDTLAQQIVDRIHSGKLPPGTCLPSQRELARIFEVGLGSVREAVKILDATGYLRVIPGKGTFVADRESQQTHLHSPVDQAMEAVSLAELMTAREVVECGAARMAAEQPDEDSLERLKAIVSRMDRDREDTDAYYRNDFAFHLAVAETSNNSAIFEIVKLLVDKSHHHLGFMTDSLGISGPENVERCLNTAREVVAGIVRGNGPQAGQAMKAHLNIVNVELSKGFFRPKPNQATGNGRPYQGQ